MKSCPKPRIEVIVEAHEPFLVKGGTALDLDILDGKIGCFGLGRVDWCKDTTPPCTIDSGAWRGVRYHWPTSRLGERPK